jgi:hypothetical protein
MLRLRTHVWICLGFLLALLALGWGGAIASDALGVAPSPPWNWLLLGLLFALLLGFAFSAVPVMVLLVTGAQRGLGTPAAGVAAPRWQNAIVYTLWGLMAAGTAVALPAAYLLGAFDEMGGKTLRDHGPSQGTLVARPGMTLAQMQAGSSLHINTGGLAEPPVLAEGIVFDFQLAGSAIRLPRCRYYYMSTFTHDPKHIENINLGTSYDKLDHHALEAADARLRAQLAADGWLTGHEEYRDEEDQTLHGGRTRGPEGDLWLKDGIVLDIESKRMDDAVEGEPADAGEWIQVVNLSKREDYPWIERWVFAPPAAASTVAR